MRKIAEISKDLSAKVTATRAMDRTDEAAFRAAMDEVISLTQELTDARAIEAAEQAAAERQFNDLEKKANRRFSIVKFIREAAAQSAGEGRLSGLEAEVAEMGAKEYERLGLTRKGFVIPTAAMRSSAGQDYTTNADGGYAKVEQMPTYIEALKERLVVAQLGAKVIGDLVGTVPFVSASAISSSWLAEGAQASVSKSTFSKATMTPHRNATVAAFSKDLLRQTSLDVENILMGLIVDSHARLIEDACINGSGSSNQPTGILAGITNAASGLVEMGTNGGAITWAKVVALETMVNSNNANRGKLAYLTNAKVIGAMKTTERTSTNGRYILDVDGKVNGYPIDYTNLVPSTLKKGSSQSGVLSAMIFGNWEDLYIGQWGGLDIVVDPFTLADYGDVRIVLNAWNDVKVVEPKSFAAIKDIDA